MPFCASRDRLGMVLGYQAKGEAATGKTNPAKRAVPVHGWGMAG